MARVGGEVESVGVDEDDDEEDEEKEDELEHLRNSDGCERWVRYPILK